MVRNYNSNNNETICSYHQFHCLFFFLYLIHTPTTYICSHTHMAPGLRELCAGTNPTKEGTSREFPSPIRHGPTAQWSPEMASDETTDIGIGPIGTSVQSIPANQTWQWKIQGLWRCSVRLSMISKGLYHNFSISSFDSSYFIADFPAMFHDTRGFKSVNCSQGSLPNPLN